MATYQFQLGMRTNQPNGAQAPSFKENMMNNFRFEVRRNGFCIFTSAPMSEDAALKQASLREKDEIGITAEVYEDDNQDCGNYHPYGDPHL